MENKILNIESLSKSYGRIKALNEVSFSLAEGEYTSLLGPNGAGKTTLFQILTGLFVSEKGNVLINNYDMRNNAIKALAHIGVVFQQITLDMDLTVMENLKFHSNLHGINDKEFKKRVIVELEQVNLANRINDKVRSLSGGQKRRVELARSLLHRPKLLLLDEPTVGLDPQSRRDLLDYVIKLKEERKMAVLWATHLVDEAEKSDTVIVLNKGEIIKKDTPQNITKEYNKDTLHDAFVSLTS
ncbi:ATP-binding cassette domain-containing protein [Alphaproteobacteria bacterium]|nr:ATP-binding cassette domain-containing protein [Alphaproteobacteria bacterium]|tara:strand:+ start:891 stop:1616 length:726 start_codon:yes stop_codon:yes gene_type:complete